MTTYANVGHILLKRGNTAQSTSYTGPLGELTYDTDLGTVRVHDNATAGGVNVLATQAQVTTLTNSLSSAVNTINNNISTITGIDATFVANINALLANASVQDAGIQSLWANAATQNSSIQTLFSNAAAQQGQINNLTTSSYGNANVATYLPHYGGEILASSINGGPFNGRWATLQFPTVPGDVDLVNDVGNVNIITNVGTTNQWTFDQYGFLTIPSGIINTPGNNVGMTANDTSINLASWNSAQSSPNSIVNLNPENVVIAANVYAAEKQWTFSQDGTLTFPDSTVQTTAWQGVTAGTTAPANNVLWYNTTDGRLYVKYNSTWVDASPTVAPAPSYYLGDLDISGNVISFPNGTLTVDGTGNLLVNGNLVTGGGSTYGNVDVARYLNHYDNSITWTDGTQILVDSGLYLSAGPVVGINSGEASWTFNNTGSTTFPNGAKLDGGTAYKFATDNSVTQYIDLRDTSQRGFYTDSNGFTLRSNNYNWVFDGTGILNLPSSTTGNSLIQSTHVIQLNANGKFFTFGTDGNLNLPGNIAFSDSTVQTTAFNPTSVAEILSGNVTIGNLFVNGTTATINTTNYSVDDNIIQIANNNPADTLDIGFVGHRTLSGQLEHTGLVRNASLNQWALFSNVVPQPGTTVDFTDAIYDDLRLDKLFADTIHLRGTPPTTVYGAAGDLAGDIHIDSNYLYYCTADYTPHTSTMQAIMNGGNIYGYVTQLAFTKSSSSRQPQTGWTITGYDGVSTGNVTLTITGVTDGGTTWLVDFTGALYDFFNHSIWTLTDNTSPATIWKTIPLTAFGNVAYSDVNVASYLTSGISSNVKTSANVVASNYLFANGVNILSTVSGGSTYSNANVASYLVASAQTIGNLTVTGTTTIGSTLQLVGSTNTISTTNGSSVQFGSGVNFNSSTRIAVNGNILAQSGTASTSTNTGAIQVSGGVGVSGNVYTGGNVTAPYFVGNAVGTTATYSGNIIAGNVITAGASGPKTRFLWDTWQANSTSALSSFTPSGTIGGNATWDSTQAYGLKLTTTATSQSGYINWNSSTINYNYDMVITTSIGASGGTGADGQWIYFGSNAAITGNPGNTNTYGGIAVMNHYYSSASQFEVYVGGTQTNIPYIGNGNYVTSGVTLWNASYTSFYNLTLKIRKIQNGNRMLEVYLNEIYQGSVNIGNWTPAGNYFGVAAYTGGSTAQNWVRQLRIDW